MNCSQMGHLKCEVEEENMDKIGYDLDLFWEKVESGELLDEAISRE